jgi:hypothetical protein
VCSSDLDEYFYEIEQMLELQDKYGLIHCFRTNQQQEMLAKVDELLGLSNLSEVYELRRELFLKETIDVSAFLIWLFENHPVSTKSYFKNPSVQNDFK